MKTLNNHFKVTDAELTLLHDLFYSGATIYRKVKLYGAAHPQLPDLFIAEGTEDEKEAFLNKHESTHATFKAYKSVRDIAKDSSFWRSDITNEGFEINVLNIKIYTL